MNLLAHGTEARVRTCVTQHPGADPWRQARAFVAAELVDLIDAGRVSLPVFQRRVLVPLELEVMPCPGAIRWRPGQLVSGLLGALPDKRTRQRR